MATTTARSHVLFFEMKFLFLQHRRVVTSSSAVLMEARPSILDGQITVHLPDATPAVTQSSPCFNFKISKKSQLLFSPSPPPQTKSPIIL